MTNDSQLAMDEALEIRTDIQGRLGSRRRVRHGQATNNLVLSASTDGNDRMFPRILALYVSDGSTVADVTYGKGVFWRHVPPARYKVLATDIQDGVDCRDLPYKDSEIDCIVLDPPYMHTPGGTAHKTQSPFEEYYRNNGSGNQMGSKYHEAVLDLYRKVQGRKPIGFCGIAEY